MLVLFYSRNDNSDRVVRELCGRLLVFRGTLVMEVYDAIMARRMIGRVQDRPLPKQEIERLLAAAVSAPNHHLTQPWRFIVLSGSALDELGEVMAERILKEKAGSADLERKVEAEKSKPRRAPAIITVVYVPSSNSKAIEVEDRYAVGAAVENMLLAATGNYLGASWKTGPAAEDPSVKEFLELSEGEEIAGFIYVGYPLEEADQPQRRVKDAAENTVWRGAVS